jgi:peptidoglycan glycosyltransferase
MRKGITEMDGRIRWVGAIILLLFVLLFVQLNNIQVRQAPTLNRNPINATSPQVTNLYFQPRGEILSADGHVLAESVPSHDFYHWRRVYPKSTAWNFAGITGAYETAEEANEYGIEASYNQYLEQHESSVRTLGELFSQHLETDDVVLTVSTKLQALAMKELAAAKEPGSALVAIDPRSGAILAMAQYPSFNPNTLAVHNPAAVVAAKAKLTNVANGDSPLYNIPTFVRHPPGSTFKVITSSALYDHEPSLVNLKFPSSVNYVFPNSGTPPKKIHNYAGEVCPPYTATLAEVLLMSCDTTFSELGVKLGAENLALEARAFGFDSVPPIDLPSSEVSPSIFPPPQVINATPFEGYSAIGQFDDAATALQMALVAAGIGNNGVIMQPYLVAKAESTYGTIEYQHHPTIWRRATSARTAVEVRDLMLGVTQNPAGTAYGVFEPYYAHGTLPPIAAKTGTAEPTSNTCGTFNWLIATGPAGSGQTPTVAVAAMVPVPQTACAAGGFNPTGATIAGPALAPVLQAALRMQKSVK